MGNFNFQVKNGIDNKTSRSIGKNKPNNVLILFYKGMQRWW